MSPRNLRCNKALLILLICAVLPGCLGPRAVRPQVTPVEGPAQAASTAPSVTLALMGDVMLGRGVKPSGETFAYLESALQSADLALANLESPLTNETPQSQSPYVLCASPQNAAILEMAGFDLLSLANNHRLDCGARGLAETQETLQKTRLGFIGPGQDPVFRQANGLSLAFLAFDATAQFNLETAAAAVSSARKTGAVVIVSIHWGNEYQSGISSAQKEIAGRLSASGAALIWGHHPHVLQPSAYINTTLVLYSLGNGLFDQNGLAGTRRSALVLVGLNEIEARMLQVIPFAIDVPGSKIQPPDSSDSSAILQYFK